MPDSQAKLATAGDGANLKFPEPDTRPPVIRDLADTGGKSGQQRAGCRLTAGRRKPMESATENIPPMVFS